MPSNILSIEYLNEDNIIFILNDLESAKEMIKRNPRAEIEHDERTGRVGLVYALDDCNLSHAVKKA